MLTEGNCGGRVGKGRDCCTSVDGGRRWVSAEAAWFYGGTSREGERKCEMFEIVCACGCEAGGRGKRGPPDGIPGKGTENGSQDTGVCAREKEQNRKSARLEFKDLLISMSILWTHPVPSAALALSGLCWPLLHSSFFTVAPAYAPALPSTIQTVTARQNQNPTSLDDVPPICRLTATATKPSTSTITTATGPTPSWQAAGGNPHTPED
jgi:hypothetical protein